MRWVVEVSSSDKTDQQKYVVDAESWQRALQAARGQRGETGPMSGFSIELLDEGYRAVDPATKNRFVVKRTADDTPLTKPESVPPPMDTKSNVAPKAPKAPTTKSVPPRPSDVKPEPKTESKKGKGKKSEKMKAAKKAETPVAPKVEPSKPTSIPVPKVTSKPPPPMVKKESEPEIIEAEEVATDPMGLAAAPPVRPPVDSVPMAPLLPVGAFVPGLPSVKLLTSREQDPSDASPLTYREYAFAVKEGTSDEVAGNVLKGQLKIIQAHLEKLKQGKLVNLAVFDAEFQGKPPGPPLATLAWKDWKGDPVMAYPRRTGAAAPQVKPPSAGASGAYNAVIPPPTSMPPQPPTFAAASPSAIPEPPKSDRSIPRPPGAIAAMINAAKIGSERKLPVAAPSEPKTMPTPGESAPGVFGHGGIPVPAGVVPGAPNPFAAPGPAPGFPPPPGSSANAFPAPPHSAPPAANPFAMPPGSAPAATNPFAVPASSTGTAPMMAPITPSQPPPANNFGQTSRDFAPPSFAQTSPPNFSQTAPVIPQSQLPVQAVPQQQHQSVPPPAMHQSVPPPAMRPSVPPPNSYAPSPMITQSQPPPQTGRQQSAPPPEGIVKTPSGRFVRGRVSGDELITQLFESMHDLHFLRDALDGGQFCLALATEMLPARVAVIHFFDIEKREWIIACTRGKDAGKLLTMRTPESDDLLRAAARHRRAIVNPDGRGATGQRYQALGGARSMIIAPIMQAGRALGALEMINPADGMPFTEDEGNAITYIAEQYAEYLGSRGIVVNPERIQAAARP